MCPEDGSLENDETCDLAITIPYMLEYTDGDGCECCEVACEVCAKTLGVYELDTRCVADQYDLSFTQCFEEALMLAGNDIATYHFSYKNEGSGKCRLPMDSEQAQADCSTSKTGWTTFSLAPSCIPMECQGVYFEKAEEKKQCVNQSKVKIVSTEEECAYEAWAQGGSRFSFFSKSDQCWVPSDDCDGENIQTPNQKANKWDVYDVMECMEAVDEGDCSLTGVAVESGYKCKKQQNNGNMSVDECAALAAELEQEFFSMKNAKKCYLPTKNGVPKGDGTNYCVNNKIEDSNYDVYMVATQCD